MCQQILINLNTNSSCSSIVSVLSHFQTSLDSEINIRYNHDKHTYIENDIYLIINSFINEIRHNGKKATVNFPYEQNEKLNYASRINFFKHLEVAYDEIFSRHDRKGNFIEINNFSPITMNISERFDDIFENDFNMSENEIFNVGFMIDELICNMSRHSKSKSGAYFYCQKFKQSKVLEIVIVDSGVGIKNSLSKSYPDLTNEEYLIKCLEFEVTSGDGRGHGLYVTSEFIRRNSCEFHMISGSNMLKIANNRTTTYPYPNWNGVILKLIISFDITNSVLDIIEDYK